MTFLQKMMEKNRDYASAAPMVLAFLGDSVTHGVFEIDMNREGQIGSVFDHEHVYHARLRRQLHAIAPAVAFNVINAGVNGGGSAQGLERLSRDVLAYQPDLVVVCFGLNDVHGGREGLPAYLDNLRRIFQEVRRQGVDLIFLSPNCMNTYVPAYIKNPDLREVAARTAELQNSGVMDLYMDGARRLCANEQVALCDCYSQWRHLADIGIDTTALLANGINHPNRDMHELFSTALFQKIIFG